MWPVPYFIVCGENDTLVDLNAVKEFHDAASSTDKSFHQYQGMKHNVWEEEPRLMDQLVDDVIGWVSEPCML